MDLSEFAFKLLILFLPGILCSYVIDIFTNHKQRTQYQFLINSFVYGLFSYGVFWLLVSNLGCLIGLDESSVNFISYLQGKNNSISFQEVFYVCIVAVVLGAAITYINTNKLHFKLFRTLKITRKFGELDVWGYLMNSDDVSWVTVRDTVNNLMYDGWVQAFSDNGSDTEVLLGDVRVYQNDSGNFLYEVASQYLSLDRKSIVIEIRKESGNE